MTIATVEPTELNVGDTWEWRREDLTVYPAPTWTLKYRFKNSTAGFEIIATADGANHVVTVLPATTATYTQGAYDWQAWVDNGTNIYTVRVGRTTLKPNLRAGAAGDALDTRTHARKVLEAIQAVLENRATLDQESYEIAGRSLKRTPIAELLQLRSLYSQEAAREEAALNGVTGASQPGRYFVRLGRG